jgi:plastocyanin
MRFRPPGLRGIGQYDTFSYAFTEAGTYEYICDFHPGMGGTITVTP